MDVAALNLNIKSDDVVSATSNLDKFVASAERAAAAGSKLSGGGNTAKMAQDYARAAQTAEQAGGAVAKASAAVQAANAHVVTYRLHLQGVVSASAQAAAAQAALATAVTRTSMATQQSDAHVITYRNNLEKAAAANKAAGAASAAAAPQVAAVGVASRATGAVVTGLAGIFGGLVGVLIGSVVSALVEVVAGLFETDKAMEAVTLASDGLSNAQGVLGKMFDLTTGKIKSQNETLRMNIQLTAMQLRADAMAASATAKTGLTNAGQMSWSSWFSGGPDGRPGAARTVRDTAARRQLQGVISGTVDGDKALQWAEKADFSGVDISRNDFVKAVVAAAEARAKNATADEIKKTMESGVLSSVFREPGSASRARATRGGGGGKSEAEKIADLVRNAQAEITAEQNRAKAVEMSAQAAAELEQKTKLLNAAASAGLKITPALTDQIEKLAAAYAAAKVDADMDEVVKSSTLEIQKQRDAIADETSLIGLYGDALARASRELEAQRKLREALPKGAIYVGGNLTSGLSDEIESDARARRIADLKKWSEDAAYAMDREQGSLRLTGKAALEYAFVSERLNQAQRDRVRQSPEDIAAINAAGAAYAEQRHAIDQQAQAIADAREITRGFFSDWLSGVREGGNVFKSFADSVINSLNRIIETMMNTALTSAMGGGGGFLSNLLGSVGKLVGGGGALPGTAGGMDLRGFALGGAFDSAQRFANGAAFTNTVVSSPTLFRYANGGKFGLMGEDGPEAIMPLSRLPNGKLGVHAMGGAGGGRPNVTMGDVHVHNSFAGAIGMDAMVAMHRQTAEQAVSAIRRDFANIAAEYETNGVVAA